MSIVTRAYTAVDRAAVLRLMASNTPRFFAPHEREEFAEFLDDLSGMYYVATDGPDVIGAGGFAADRLPGEVVFCWFMVDATRHGSGVGTSITGACWRGILTDPAFQTVRLDTSQHSRTFFERWGFTATLITPDGYATGMDRIDMQLELDPPTRDAIAQRLSG